MTIRFNSQLLMADVEKARKRRKISMLRAARRMGLHTSTLYNLLTGKISDITVTTLARLLDFLGDTDVGKYLYDDGE